LGIIENNFTKEKNRKEQKRKEKRKKEKNREGKKILILIWTSKFAS
jgi:hypothetical protein